MVFFYMLRLCSQSDTRVLHPLCVRPQLEEHVGRHTSPSHTHTHPRHMIIFTYGWYYSTGFEETKGFDDFHVLRVCSLQKKPSRYPISEFYTSFVCGHSRKNTSGDTRPPPTPTPIFAMWYILTYGWYYSTCFWETKRIDGFHVLRVCSL